MSSKAKMFKGSTVAIILVLVVASVFVGLLTNTLYNKYIDNGTTLSALPGAPTPTPVETNNAPQALQFALTDPLQGGAIASASILVYNNQNVQTDSLTSGSNGLISTSSLWTPGQTGYVIVSKATYVTVAIPFTVPSTATIGQYGTPTYYIPLSDVIQVSPTIKAMDNLGNAIVTTDILDYNTYNSTITLYFTTYNTAINTGYITSYNPLDGVNQAAAVAITADATNASYLIGGISGLSGAQTVPASGNRIRYSALFADSALTNQKVGQTQVLNGQASFSMTFNAQAMNGAETFTMTIVAPFDSTYYAANGVGGPNAVALATFTFTILHDD